ncbi:hypothetical protein ACO0QE_004477 [Hanseniaspora vineae]
MSFYFRNIKPEHEAEDAYEQDNDHLDDILRQESSDEESDEFGNTNGDDEDDGLSKVSFGSLKQAHDDYVSSERKSKRALKSTKKPVSDEIKNQIKQQMQEKASLQPKMFKEESFDESDSSKSDSDQEGLFEEEIASKKLQRRNEQAQRDGQRKGKKGSNHAPSEQSSKKPVSFIRDIPGLQINKKYKDSATYQDIRFDKSLGKSEDFNKVRSRYKFLDEYREQEIKTLEASLKDKRFLSKINEYEQAKLEERLRSMKSKLQTLQNKDLENEIVKKYTEEINSKSKNKFYLKDSDKRKIINKYKFDHMKASQREKVMERKRKKQLGKEMRQFEFNK